MFDLPRSSATCERVADGRSRVGIPPLFAMKSFPHPRVRELAARTSTASMRVARRAARRAGGDDRVDRRSDGRRDRARADGRPRDRRLRDSRAGARCARRTRRSRSASPRRSRAAIRRSVRCSRAAVTGARDSASGSRRRSPRSCAPRRAGRVGLHVHHGPVTATSAERFIATARAAIALAGFEPAFINLGGAWHGIADIAAAFAEIRAAFPHSIEIFVEPGRLYARMRGSRPVACVSSRELSAIACCGSSSCRASVTCAGASPSSSRGHREPGEGRKVQLVGPTCYEEDVIGEWIVEPAHVADARRAAQHQRLRARVEHELWWRAGGRRRGSSTSDRCLLRAARPDRSRRARHRSARGRPGRRARCCCGAARAPGRPRGSAART